MVIKKGYQKETINARNNLACHDILPNICNTGYAIDYCQEYLWQNYLRIEKK